MRRLAVVFSVGLFLASGLSLTQNQKAFGPGWIGSASGHAMGDLAEAVRKAHWQAGERGGHECPNQACPWWQTWW